MIAVQDFLGQGIFDVDGRAWLEARHLLRPLFLKTRVADLMILEKYAQYVMGLFGGQGQKLDISGLSHRYYPLRISISVYDHLMYNSRSTLETANFSWVEASLVHDHSSFAKGLNEVLRVERRKTITGPLNWLIPLQSSWHGLEITDSFVE